MDTSPSVRNLAKQLLVSLCAAAAEAAKAGVRAAGRRVSARRGGGCLRRRVVCAAGRRVSAEAGVRVPRSCRAVQSRPVDRSRLGGHGGGEFPVIGGELEHGIDPSELY